MNDFKNTLNLPTTLFSMRANLTQKEPKILEKWKKDNLYQYIRLHKQKKKLFIIHDGPPYANGKIHLGHALNKVLKDIIIKSKSLSGYNVPFVPTWDCHGLPIEHQVEQNIFKKIHNLSNKEFRKKCRSYAHKQVLQQKSDFIRLGIIANWNNPFLTMDFTSEANIVLNLAKIIKKGYVYRDFKPVHWCIQCNSSLAEAELEYLKIECKSIYLTFKGTNSSKFFKKFQLHSNLEIIKLLIWTTTPWSLASNQAIAVHPKIDYQFIQIKTQIFIVAKNIVSKIMDDLHINKWKILGLTRGKNLENLKVFHPFLNVQVPIILSNHVKLDIGTGIVHIASDYGIDDFIACKKYNIKPLNLIDEKGNYSKNIHSLLNGMNIFNTDDIIIKLLQKNQSLIKIKKIIHAYPHCWRHKHPTFFRATPQWFINIQSSDLKNNCLSQIKNIKWIPQWGQQRIISMLDKRPDWCISRQRSWGVPIPIFLHKQTGKLHPQTYSLLKKIALLISKQGIDAWWNLDKHKILGSESKEYFKNTDILDVWFDSGSVTVDSVYDEYNSIKTNQADLYLEGSDQYRGWFMSSLIISTAIHQISPYRGILTHGFIVDQLGRKMSKSIGNTVTPEFIINKFGADILRLWVASTDYSKEITISNLILNHITESYRRIRNTARFLIANLNDFKPDYDIVSPKNILLLDKWIIGKTKSLQTKIISLYESYNFHSIIHHLMQFCSIELGSFYLDIVKDRLYTMKPNSIARKSCQTSLYIILQSFVRWIAPILSFTADEIWDYIPGKKNKYVFSEEWFYPLFSFSKSDILNIEHWKKLILLKSEVNKILEQSIKNKLILNSLNACLTLYVNSDLYEILKILGEEIKFMFITSKVTIKNYNDAPPHTYKITSPSISKIEIQFSKKEKCIRCWHYVLKKQKKQTNIKYKKICDRCIKNTSGMGEKRLFL